MNQPEERVVPWLYRHFGDKGLPENFLSFRYHRREYPIREITSTRMFYGTMSSQLDDRDRYYAINFTVKRSLFGLKAVFDLVSQEDLDDMRS